MSTDTTGINMASHKFIIRKGKARDDGTAPIYLQIIAHRKVRRKSTGIWIKPRYWNDDRQEVRKSHELSRAYNEKLHELYLKAERARMKGGTADAMKRRVEGSSGTLDSYLSAFIEKLSRRDQYWERRKYATLLNKLQECFASEVIEWSQLTPGGLEDFEDYLREVRENNPNTTRKELSRLRRVVTQAVKDGALDMDKDPFVRYDLPKRAPVVRRRLRREEIAALEAVELEGEMAVARDAFIFSFYAGGMRAGDVFQVRPENIREGRLRYTMMKTGQPVDLPLPAAALTIVERYAGADGPFVFPILPAGSDSDPVKLRRRISSANVGINRRIKEACKLAGIREPDEVSFHVARHSFADFARKHTSDLYAVSKALGHKDLGTTERYLSTFDREATDKLANDLWGDDDDE